MNQYPARLPAGPLDALSEMIERAVTKPANRCGRDVVWEDIAGYDGTLYRGRPCEVRPYALAAERPEPRIQHLPFPVRQ
jgi:hypothetical protein